MCYGQTIGDGDGDSENENDKDKDQGEVVMARRRRLCECECEFVYVSARSHPLRHTLTATAHRLLTCKANVTMQLEIAHII